MEKDFFSLVFVGIHTWKHIWNVSETTEKPILKEAFISTVEFQFSYSPQDYEARPPWSDQN